MSTAPDRIYLQDDGDFAEASLADLTWCGDKINDADTGYVRADLFDALTAERDALRVALQQIVNLDTGDTHHVLAFGIARRALPPGEPAAQEQTADNAPLHYSADEAAAWASGFNAALGAMEPAPTSEPSAAGKRLFCIACDHVWAARLTEPNCYFCGAPGRPVASEPTAVPDVPKPILNSLPELYVPDEPPDDQPMDGADDPGGNSGAKRPRRLRRAGASKFPIENFCDRLDCTRPFDHVGECDLTNDVPREPEEP